MVSEIVAGTHSTAADRRSSIGVGEMVGAIANSRYTGNAIQRERGFTLVELVVTIGIGSILVALAIPAYINFVENEREFTQANNLVFAANFARSEAIKRDSVICICPSADGATCEGSTVTSPWSAGWIVHIPLASSDCTVPSTAANSILQSSGSISSKTFLTACVGTTAACAASPVTGTLVSSVNFQTSGLVTSNNGTGSGTVMFKYCDPRGTGHATDIELTPSGRPETAQTLGYAVNGTTKLQCP